MLIGKKGPLIEIQFRATIHSTPSHPVFKMPCSHKGITNLYDYQVINTQLTSKEQNIINCNS